MRLIASYGQSRMKQDISQLKSRTEMWYNFCVASENAAQTNLIRFQNKHSENSTCWMLTAKELQFTRFVRKRQLHHLSNSVFQKVNINSTVHTSMSSDIA